MSLLFRMQISEEQQLFLAKNERRLCKSIYECKEMRSIYSALTHISREISREIHVISSHELITAFS